MAVGSPCGDRSAHQVTHNALLSTQRIKPLAWTCSISLISSVVTPSAISSNFTQHSAHAKQTVAVFFGHRIFEEPRKTTSNSLSQPTLWLSSEPQSSNGVPRRWCGVNRLEWSGVEKLRLCRESGASLRWNTILWMGSHLMQGMRGRRPYFAEELPTPGKAHSKLLQLLRDQTWSAEPDMECSPIPGDDVRASAAHAVEPLRAVGLLESVQFAAHGGFARTPSLLHRLPGCGCQPSRHQGPTRRRSATASSSTRCRSSVAEAAASDERLQKDKRSGTTARPFGRSFRIA